MSTPLSIRDSAVLAGVTEKTIRRWIQSGRLKAEKLGGQYQINIVDLDAVRVDMPPVQASSPTSTHETQAASTVQTERVDTGQPPLSSPSIDLQPLADVIERQGQEIRRLTEASTIWQFRAMQAEERLKQLTAGRDVAEGDDDEREDDEISTVGGINRRRSHLDPVPHAKSSQTRDVAPGATTADGLSVESNSEAQKPGRSGFGGLWDWLRGK